MSFPCPCCGHLVFPESPGSYEICPICYWEDDAIQLRWPDWAGGANRPSLVEAQQNFIQFSAMEDRFVPNVRPPTEPERLDEGWRPIDVDRDQFEPLGIQQAAWPRDATELYYWRPTFWGPERIQRAIRGDRARRFDVLVGGRSVEALTRDSDRVLVRVLDGASLRTRDDLYDAFAEAFAFPSYFGRNLDALYDCLRDLEWLDDRNIRLIIREADRLLEGAPSDRVRILRLLADIGDYWANPPNADVLLIRPRDFLVLLQVPPERKDVVIGGLSEAGLAHGITFEGGPRRVR